VLSNLRFTILAAALLPLSGLGLAQNQDPERFGLPKNTASELPPAQRVDINHASLEQLLNVPGLTESWARRVIRFRPYRTKLDLLETGVVNNQVYDRMKNFVIAHRDKP
jgi:DNA uptake protein ComE-like DNA-binding protein